MIFLALSKCAFPGLYDRTCSAVTIKSNGTDKCLNVPANKSSSTFERIPNLQLALNFLKAGFVSSKGFQLGRSSARKPASLFEILRPAFEATLLDCLR